jgi:rhodanese-related sulfurtransferase
MSPSSSVLLQPHDLLSLQRAHHQAHAPVVIDIRGARAYRKAHIPGSHPIAVPALLSSEPLDADLVLVGHRHEDTEAVAQGLYDAGFHRRIQQLEGGFPRWQEQGFEVASLKPVASAAPFGTTPWLAVLFGFAPSLFALLAERAWQQSLRRAA